MRNTVYNTAGYGSVEPTRRKICLVQNTSELGNENFSLNKLDHAWNMATIKPIFVVVSLLLMQKAVYSIFLTLYFGFDQWTMEILAISVTMDRNGNSQFLLCYILILYPFILTSVEYALREKCQNTEFPLVRIFLYSVQMQENVDQKKIRIWTFFTRYMWHNGQTIRGQNVHTYASSPYNNREMPQK